MCVVYIAQKCFLTKCRLSAFWVCLILLFWAAIRFFSLRITFFASSEELWWKYKCQQLMCVQGRTHQVANWLALRCFWTWKKLKIVVVYAVGSCWWVYVWNGSGVRFNDSLTEDGLNFTLHVKGRVGEWLSHRLGLTHTLFHVLNTQFSWYRNN